MTPACHLEGSSTPSHAKEIATATSVNMMVMLGLGPRQTVACIIGCTESPPLTIVRPGSNEEKQDCLDGETDAVREENDRIDCEAVRVKGALALVTRMQLLGCDDTHCL